MSDSKEYIIKILKKEIEKLSSQASKKLLIKPCLDEAIKIGGLKTAIELIDKYYDDYIVWGKLKADKIEDFEK